MAAPRTDDPAIHAAALGEQFESFLDDHRHALSACLDGITQDEGRLRLVPSKTTLLGLVKHATLVEQVWFDEVITCRSRVEIGCPADPDASFELDPSDAIESVRATYRRLATPLAPPRPTSAPTTSSEEIAAGRCRFVGCTCTCCASSRSTAAMPTSCESSFSRAVDDR